jgi:hypothetical protein
MIVIVPSKSLVGWLVGLLVGWMNDSWLDGWLVQMRPSRNLQGTSQNHQVKYFF